MTKKKQPAKKGPLLSVCENCGVDFEDDDSVQKRNCGHVLCEDCMPCPLCEEG